MLALRMRRAELSTELENLDHFLAVTLGEAYRPLLAQALRSQAEVLGVDPAMLKPAAPADERFSSSRVRYAEVLVVDEGVVAVELRQELRRGYSVPGAHEMAVRENDRQLMLYGIGQRGIDSRVAEVAAAIEAEYEISFEPFNYESDRLQQLKAEGLNSPTPPTPDEVAAAEVLADAATRRAAIAIASSGGLLRSDVPKQLHPDEQDRSEDIIRTLREVNVVDCDLVVICGRGSTQVARVPDQDALEKAAAAGMRCACGRGILDEKAEEALALSSLGRQLLDGSRWMSVLLIERLHVLGINYDSMLVEQKSGGDEMDCFADLSGELALFELKDKEFSLGNAYSFGAKISIHRPEHAVVVTTSYVGNDAKEHFKRSQNAGSDFDVRARAQARPIRYVEGLAGLSTDLEDLVDGICTADASRILGSLLSAAATDAGSVVTALNERFA